jgi:hypothetical protein
MNETHAEPLTVFRLRGSQAQMGRQHGTLAAAHGDADRPLRFYQTMASMLLSLSVPRLVRGPVERVLRRAVGLGSRRLAHARARRFPEYAARTEALFAAAGMHARDAHAVTVMDVLQNTVGTLGRFGLLHRTGLSTAAVPACTSLAVWGEASADAQLRHARNFDFPGAGIWDRAPSVVLCDPDDGLRYGFVTTRAADVPAVTAFNEAGLSLTAHTRFHRDVDFSGVSVIDYGHEIIRRCRTLADVRRVASSMRAASTWGFLVSSAQEQDAVVIETTARGTGFSHPGGHAYLSCANRYLAPDLQVGEVTPSPSFAVDSDARAARADSALARAGGRLDRAGLQRLLGDTGDPGAPDPDADDRLVGNCIVSAMAVQSVVLEPERSSVRLSVGPAPTGLGPWVDVPYAWDGPVGEVAIDTTPVDDVPRSRAATEAMRRYVAATRAHLAGAAPAVVRKRVEQAVAAAPSEPNLRFLAGILAIVVGDFETAQRHLQHAVTREHGPYRRALASLWHGRALAVLGRTDEAHGEWRRIDALEDVAGIEPLRAAAQRERRRPLGRRRLRAVVPDLFLIDATLPL